jgi:hypothetical protein
MGNGDAFNIISSARLTDRFRSWRAPRGTQETDMSSENHPDLILGTQDRDCYRVTAELVDVTRPCAPVLAARIAANPQNLLFDLHKTAIVIIDMQNDFCSPDGWMGAMGVDTSRSQALAVPINRLTDCARATGVPVIWSWWAAPAPSP